MGGKGAHGDLTGVGGPGGFATKVGFSLAGLRTRPALPPKPPGFAVGRDDACEGAGDLGLLASRASESSTTGAGEGNGTGVSSA
jgi:hypothetical protein